MVVTMESFKTEGVKDSSVKSPWLPYLQAGWEDARIRLFCFHYAGGGASNYRAWAAEMPPEIGIGAVQLPGRETRLREPAFTRLAPLVQALAQGLTPYLDRPCAFFGHSMGALVAFELTRHLRRQGKPQPKLIIASGHNAPHILDPDPPDYLLPEAQFLEKLKTFNGTPQEILEHPELLQLVLPILRADLGACETYRYYQEEALNVPIMALGGVADPEVRAEYLQAWQIHTAQEFKIQFFPGDHFFINTARAEVLELVRQALQQFY